MRSLRLAGLTLKSMLSDTPLARAALIAIVLVPLLYGALYLWAFWDPYGKLDTMPVAVVNLDRPVTVDGEQLSAGQDLVDELVDGHDVGWTVVSASEAEKGLAERRYYLSLTIPADFSEELATANSQTPHRARLVVVAQESSNMLASQIMSRVFAEVRAAASESASSKYLDKMFVGFADAHDGLTDAALGAEDLRDGLAEARDGAEQLADGESQAYAGAAQLSSGLSELSGGADKLDAGAATLAGGTATLAGGLSDAAPKAGALGTGAAQVSAGAGQLQSALGQLSGGASTVASSAAALSAGAMQLQLGLGDALGKLGQAKDGASQVAAGAAGVSTLAHALATAHPELASDPTLQQLVGTADVVKAGSSQLASGLETAVAGAPALAVGAKQVAGGASALATGAAQLAGGAKQAYAATGQLAAGTTQVATGASQLAVGVGSAASGASKLATGAATLAAGANTLADGASEAAAGSTELESGLAQLDDGAHELAAGLPEAVDGAEQLRSGLASGAADAPAYDEKVRSANAEMMSAPVELTTTRRGAVPTYGTGFTPYFIPLALWVGALLTYFILAPLPNRALASGANPVVSAMASYLPGSALGVLQAVILMAVVQFGLGLKPANTLATYAFTVLVALVFIAILQMLNGAFGAVGKLISIVLLMLQLTSAGGTFPVEMVPGFFQALNPYLPMSYVVLGLRQTVSGGDMAAAAHAALVLLGFGLSALAITVFAAWRRQMWTMERLHPSLEI